MANKERFTEVGETTELNEKAIEEAVKGTPDHTCLLYWHSRNVARIPLGISKGKRRHLILYPGYNAFNSADIKNIYTQCQGHIESGMLELKFMDISDEGKIKETKKLEKLSSKELAKILEATYNPETLDLLSRPDVVPAAYVSLVKDRQTKISQAVGNEADNLIIVNNKKGGI